MLRHSNYDKDTCVKLLGSVPLIFKPILGMINPDTFRVWAMKLDAVLVVALSHEDVRAELDK